MRQGARSGIEWTATNSTNTSAQRHSLGGSTRHRNGKQGGALFAFNAWKSTQVGLLLERMEQKRRECVFLRCNPKPAWRSCRCKRATFPAGGE